MELIKQIKNQAFELGFDFCRIIPVYSPRYKKEFENWLNNGFNAELGYMERGRDIRLNPQNLEPAPNSVVVLGMNYQHKKLPDKITCDPNFKKFGIVANYALGVNAKFSAGKTLARDYHKDILPKLITLDQFISAKSARTVKAKAWVDTGPVLERDFAEQAGIGFIGKNTCIINNNMGSWIFLATIWLPEKFPENSYDKLSEKILRNDINIISLPNLSEQNEQNQHTKNIGSCGNCIRCLQDCPTKALEKPYQLNAGLCISYWTIESKTPAPPELAKLFGNRIFGCDICQDVCPWNMRLEKSDDDNVNIEDYIFPNGTLIPLAEGFNKNTPYWLDDEAFIEKFAGSAIMRAKRLGMLRNVNIALANAKA